MIGGACQGIVSCATAAMSTPPTSAQFKSPFGRPWMAHSGGAAAAAGGPGNQGLKGIIAGWSKAFSQLVNGNTETVLSDLRV